MDNTEKTNPNALPQAVLNRLAMDNNIALEAKGELTETAAAPVVKTKARKLTVAIAREYVVRLGGTLRGKNSAGDYRLRMDGEDYFSDSVADIVGTARFIAGCRGGSLAEWNRATAEAWLKETGIAQA